MVKRAKPANPRAKLFKAAFAAAIRDGWRGLMIADIAKEAGLTVGEAYKVAPDRASLMDAYVEGIDAVAIEALSKETGEGTWRDFAFDGLMLRFDAMMKDRDALRVIYFDDRRDVIALARGARRTRKSLERVLEMAGFAEDSMGLRLGAVALLPLYARIFRIWLNDEADQAKTMSALDKALGRLERLAARVAGARGTRRYEDDDLDGEDEAPPASESLH